MSDNWKPVRVVLALGLVGVGGLITFLFGLHAYMVNTPPLHRDARAVPSAPAANPSPAWAAAVDHARRILRDGLAAQSLPGVSVAVGVDGAIVWAEGFGFADLDARVPVTPETRFRIGTASTVLTSAAAGLLIEQGRLDLDREIQAYVPEFPAKPSPVTLRRLMGHVAGLRTDGGDEGPLFAPHCGRPLDALPYFAHRTLLFEPGTRFRFSSYGWILVSAAIESAAGTPLHAFMQSEVFAPLGMRDTLADTTTAAEPPRGQPTAVPGRATSYFPRYGADPRYGLHLMRPLDHSCYAGASGLLSTPSDLVRFGLALRDGRLLKPETVQLLQSSLRLNSGEETGYGLGWDLDTVTLNGAATRVAGHDGAVLGGPVASFVTLPERGLVVAVIANISYADTPSLARKVAEAFAGQASPPAGR